MSYEVQWALAFLATLLLEGAVHQLLLPTFLGARQRVAWVTLGLNASTHPALWFLVPSWSPRWAWLLVNEAAVVAVEAALLAAILRREGWEDAARTGWLVALAANLFSAGVGLVLTGG